ncbi:MAG: prepilin-type N-terminal cleavage/methylation domain-containing protein [Elusimicrobiota bacterium]|nr:prepilin-type N-terminal cleavage/methylation domain-containing protein [Elusimicrobiota bacterium]
MAVKKQISGITLIEMLLAIAIFSVISVAVYTVFRSGTKTYSATQKNLKLQENLEKIVDTMVSDLQQCRCLLHAGPSEVSFWDLRGQKITYAVSDNIIYRNGIPVLEEGLLVSHIQFSYFSRGNPVENYDGDLNTRQIDDITLVEFIVSITDGSQSMEISSAVNIKRSG